jgi:hypothetical protein
VKADLSLLALALDGEHERLGWGQPARLYGIAPGFTWALVDEGEPYTMLDLFAGLPGERHVALALVCEGWAAPMDGAVRPSAHPRRERIRSVAVVGIDGTTVTSLRRRGRSAELLDSGGGALFERLRLAATRLYVVDGEDPSAA